MPPSVVRLYFPWDAKSIRQLRIPATHGLPLHRALTLGGSERRTGTYLMTRHISSSSSPSFASRSFDAEPTTTTFLLSLPFAASAFSPTNNPSAKVNSVAVRTELHHSFGSLNYTQTSVCPPLCSELPGDARRRRLISPV